MLMALAMSLLFCIVFDMWYECVEKIRGYADISLQLVWFLCAYYQPYLL